MCERSLALPAQVPFINSSLAFGANVSQADTIAANEKPKRAFQGQNPVHDGFFLSLDQASAMLKQNPKLREVIFPHMIGRDLVENNGPTRYAIDFAKRDLLEAMEYKEAFERVKRLVMPTVLEKADKEKIATGKASTRWSRMADRWWQFRDYQPGTMAAIAAIPRYIGCPRVMRRQIFEFVSSSIHPNDKLQVFALPDDYSFGIISSGIHWGWFVAKCTTLKADYNYNTASVWDTFPWPQQPTAQQVWAIAEAAVNLRRMRHEKMAQHRWNLRALYRTLEVPGKNPLRDVHDALDLAVRVAYGMSAKTDVLGFLLDLNQAVSKREKAGVAVVGPGLPPCITDPAPFITSDCIQPPAL